MDLTYVTIIVLAALIFTLSGVVGYLYWQQTRIVQHLASLSLAFTSHMTSVGTDDKPHEEVEETEETEDAHEVEEEDDRASVSGEEVQTVEIVTAAPEAVVESDSDDVDDIQSKTTKQLQELLTKKGIPFGKRESKTTLMELLKATL